MSRIDPRTALSRLLTAVEPGPEGQVPIEEALGRVLAREICADRDHPAVDVSAMDGFAGRAIELQGDRQEGRGLPVSGDASMGHMPQPLPPGCVMTISTGAPIPPGADVVIPVEHRAAGAGVGELALSPSSPDPARGAHIRRRGQNLKEGDVVLPVGTPVSPAALGVLATFGVARPHVFRKVDVGLVVTGDELVSERAVPSPAQIRDANGWVMEGFLRGIPWVRQTARSRVPDAPGPSPEEDDPLRAVLERHLRTDRVVLVSGGVSKGDDDRVRCVLEELGVRVLFHGVRSRPGRPLLAGVAPDGTAVLGLPGNPVSVLACLYRFGLPLLRRSGGWSDPEPALPRLLLEAPGIQAHPTLHRLEPVESLPGHPDGPVRLIDWTGSSDLGAVARGEGLVEIPAGESGTGPFRFHSWTL